MTEDQHTEAGRSPVTRRKFLKNLGATTAGVTLASLSPWMDAVAAAIDADADKGAFGSGNPDYAAAFRLLTAATFGPTPKDVTVVLNKGWETWIDAQMSMPETSATDYMKAISINDLIVLQEFRRLKAGGTTPVCATANPQEGCAYGTLSPTMNDQSYQYLLRRNGTSALYDIALFAPDQLRHRVAHALSQIFVISDRDLSIHSRGYPRAEYWEMLGRNAFGNFHDLLNDVVRSPMMGIYLSHRGNQKAHVDNGVLQQPDENMARELLQLFTIGVEQLNKNGTPKQNASGQPIPAFTEADVKDLAKILTGLWDSRFHDDSKATTVFAPTTPESGNGYLPKYEQHGLRAQMKFFGVPHDDSEKEFTFTPSPFPAGADPDTELRDFIIAVIKHPNTAPFICKRLIQHLTTSNPTNQYVEDVAKVFDDTKGDLGAVVKAILMHGEFDSPHQSHLFGKTKDPLIRHLGFLRAVGFSNGYPLSNYPGDVDYKIRDSGLSADGHRTLYGDHIAEGLMITRPLGAPSVFGYFPPRYRPDTDAFDGKTLAGQTELLVAPETKVLGGASMITAFNRQFNFIEAINPITTSTNRVSPNFAPIPNVPGTDHLQKITVDYDQFLPATTPASIVTAVDRLLFGYGMSVPMRNAMTKHLTASGLSPSEQIRMALKSSLASPEYAVQR